MTPREELVCKLRSEGMVYRLIGKELGVTGQRARDIYEKVQRKKRALERLKERELIYKNLSDELIKESE